MSNCNKKLLPYRHGGWVCPRCGTDQFYTGHRCRDPGCKRRICCTCFDHLDGVCLDAGLQYKHGFDYTCLVTSPHPLVAPCKSNAPELNAELLRRRAEYHGEER